MRLKDLRIEKGLSQTELSELLGVHQTAVGKYERGVLEPNLNTLKKLSAIFEVSIDYLLGIEDDFGNVVVHGSPTAELGAGEKDLLQNFRKLPEDLRHRAQAYMKKLVELSEEEISDTFARR